MPALEYKLEVKGQGSEVAHLLHPHHGLQVKHDPLLGDELQPALAGSCVGHAVLLEGVELLSHGRHKTVGKGGGQHRQTLGEKEVHGLQETHVWGRGGGREGGRERGREGGREGGGGKVGVSSFTERRETGHLL